MLNQPYNILWLTRQFTRLRVNNQCNDLRVKIFSTSKQNLHLSSYARTHLPSTPTPIPGSQQNTMLVYVPEWYTKLENISLSLSHTHTHTHTHPSTHPLITQFLSLSSSDFLTHTMPDNEGARKQQWHKKGHCVHRVWIMGAKKANKYPSHQYALFWESWWCLFCWSFIFVYVHCKGHFLVVEMGWGSRSTLDYRSTLSDRSCTWGMFHRKIHLINLGCPWPGIALHCRIMA